MPVSANAELPLIDAWGVALAHAGLNDDDFYLLSCPGAVLDGYAKAASYEPGTTPKADDLLSGEVLVEANEPEHLVKHRVAVFEDADWDNPVNTAIMTATLRHEIEHARQRMVCGKVLFDVDQYADDVISYKAGGLPGSNVLYNLKPVEQDANAAAAMLLTALFDLSIVEAVLESPDASLARSLIPPGRWETLLPRTISFMYLFADAAEAESRQENGISFDRRLDVVSKQAGDLWRDLMTQGQDVAG